MANWTLTRTARIDRKKKNFISTPLHRWWRKFVYMIPLSNWTNEFGTPPALALWFNYMYSTDRRMYCTNFRFQLLYMNRTGIEVAMSTMKILLFLSISSRDSHPFNAGIGSNDSRRLKIAFSEVRWKIIIQYFCAGKLMSRSDWMCVCVSAVCMFRHVFQLPAINKWNWNETHWTGTKHNLWPH